ncbi:AAEL013434-PA [Aedes aegypti]|uniref:AAEL013434-PA n=1 Tax=Aedes aegypti TaxID=7159 RepID=Q16J60_AEDAE|nr:AAEL013434-PA [Aedes aegypti]
MKQKKNPSASRWRKPEINLFYAKQNNQPTESSSAIPLIRQRTDANTTNGNESSLSDADVQKRIQEVFNRKGYSNPDPSPNDSLEAQPEEVAVRIDSAAPTRRRKRPLWKLDEKFDPRKSYVIKHPNGTITYVPPKDIDLSGTVDTGTTTAPANSNANELIDKMSEASTSDRDKLRSSRFVFPSDLEPRIDRTECTPDYPVCTNVIDYPHDLINDIVGRQKERFAEVFGNDIVLNDGDKLVQRFDVDENGNSFEFICESRERLIHPRSGFNTDNRTIMIINTKEYMQGVRIETCSSQGQPCVKLNPLFGKTECRQLYHYRTLLAIDPQTNQPYKEKFKLPSCCKCVIITLDGSSYRKKRDTKEGL